MLTGVELIAQERHEQVVKHHRTISDDVKYNSENQLTCAAAVLLRLDDEFSIVDLMAQFGKLKGWDLDILRRMDAKPYKERLITAGALIAAELDRIQQVENQQKNNG